METKLDGTWKADRAEMASGPLPPAVVGTLVLTIDGNRYRVQNDTGTLKFLENERMEIFGEDGPNKGKIIPAIWRLSGNILKICYNLAGQEWPEGFELDPSRQLFLVTYSKYNA